MKSSAFIVLLGERFTMLAHSQSCPSKRKALSKHKGQLPPPLGPLCCSLMSCWFGIKTKMAPYSLVSIQGISQPELFRKPSQKSESHQDAWSPLLLHLSLVNLGFKTPNLCFIFGMLLGFKTPDLKGTSTALICSLLQIRESLCSY